MKKQTAALLIAASTAVIALALPLLPGCTTLNPTTGQHEYDPVKTDNVKAAIEPFTSGVILETMRNSPEHSVQIASYYRALGNVFKRMEAEGAFTPDQLITEADKVTLPLQANLPSLAILGKNAVLNVYRIAWNNRFRAELSPEKWPVHVADLIASSIDRALKDAGKPPLDVKTGKPA